SPSRHYPCPAKGWSRQKATPETGMPDTWRADDFSPASARLRQPRSASPTMFDTARPRLVRRPMPGEEFSITGPAMTWAMLEQLPGQNTELTATRRQVAPQRRCARAQAAVRRRVAIRIAPRASGALADAPLLLLSCRNP